MSQVLEFALPTFVADGALHGVVDENQLHQLIADGFQLGRSGDDLHTLVDVSGASRQGPGWSGLYFHYADAAGADGVQGLMVTESGDEDPVLPGYVQDGGAFLGPGRPARRWSDLP